MTRVIYDHQVFSWQEYGGISRYFYELAGRVAASQEFSASVFAPFYVNRYLRGGDVSVKGIQVPFVARALKAQNTVNRYIESAFFKWGAPDIVHETYYQANSSAPKGCPVVITVHDMIQEKFTALFGRQDETSAKKRAAVERADRVICVSNNTRSDLMQLFAPDPKKIRTIHLGVGKNKRSRLTRPPELRRPFFLYVGLRGGYKNFDNVLLAYASRPSLYGEFDLLAFGSDGFTQLENESIRALGLSFAQVRHVSGADAVLDYLYGHATALVYPSLYEGFGIPPLEAMNCGCPVLCSNVSSIPEIVGAAGLYFDPTDVDAIAQSMERISAQADLRADLIAKGNERKEQFSWEKCAAQTMDVYRELSRDMAVPASR